jgi:hypothetical protein
MWIQLSIVELRKIEASCQHLLTQNRVGSAGCLRTVSRAGVRMDKEALPTPHASSIRSVATPFPRPDRQPLRFFPQSLPD